MADLRALVTDLGYEDVRTLLNSGNVVFSGRRASDARIAETIERVLEREVGVRARVTVLAAPAFSGVVRDNPLESAIADPARFLVAFLRDPVKARAQLAPILAREWGRERFALGDRAAYLWCADGILESALIEAAGRVLGDEVTMRNWTTVTKLAAML